MKRHDDRKSEEMQKEQGIQEGQEVQVEKAAQEPQKVQESQGAQKSQEVQEPQVELVQMQGRVDELTADLQRTRADFENYRKQVELQKENERKMVKLVTVSRVLPLLDDIERAIVTYEELKPLEGSLAKTLKELGLAKIEADEGVEFNPDLHEAVMAEGDGEKEVIAEVLRPGYYYGAEVLRPSMVKVKKM